MRATPVMAADSNWRPSPRWCIRNPAKSPRRRPLYAMATSPSSSPSSSSSSSSSSPSPSPSPSPLSPSSPSPFPTSAPGQPASSTAAAEERRSSRKATARTQLTQFGAGALAGLVNTLVLSPLDVVKTRLQVQGTSALARARYSGILDALRTILREEGFRAYYRGLSASLWAFVPNWAIYWYSYESFKRRYTPPGARSSPLVHVMSALSAGGITAVTTAPFWTLKSRLQVDMSVAGSLRRYRSVPHGIRRIVAEEGLSGLYKGLVPTLFGLGHVAIQFPLYEHLKLRAITARQRAMVARTGANGDHENATEVNAVDVLVASSLSKIVASTVFYPHEVIRTRIQVDTTAVRKSYEAVRVVKLCRDILKADGLMGIYRGFGANLVRTVPACMLTFTCYELAKRFAEVQGDRIGKARLARANALSDRRPRSGDR